MLTSFCNRISLWFDNDAVPIENDATISWFRVAPFIAMHIICLMPLFVGYSATALLASLFLYWLRLFAIGAFYHRYFSHKTFKTSRACQLVFAILGASSVQRGPLWWAAHHREHHLSSDTENDAHSPVAHGFWWSHMGWFLSKKHFHYNKKRVQDWAKYPELALLDRYDTVIPFTLILLLYFLGQGLNAVAPSLNTSGLQLVIWGFFVSTIAVFHTTVSINSLAHRWGKRRYKTDDNSRNSFILALLTLGEGWHNNHHHYPATARQGFFWWEIDITYYLLKLLEKTGLIWELKGVPSHVRENSEQQP